MPIFQLFHRHCPSNISIYKLYASNNFYDFPSLLHIKRINDVKRTNTNTSINYQQNDRQKERAHIKFILTQSSFLIDCLRLHSSPSKIGGGLLVFCLVLHLHRPGQCIIFVIREELFFGLSVGFKVYTVRGWLNENSDWIIAEAKI